MRTRLRHVSEQLAASYWFVPLAMMAAAILLAIATLGLDRRFFAEDEAVASWLHSGGAEGARSLLAAIAGAVATVAGVVFSINMVTVAQASMQFGPRILRSYMRDGRNQRVLGTFVGTFTYALLVLRSVRAEDGGFVPHLSITVGVLLAVASAAVLVYFIHHTAASLQAPEVVARVADELRAAIDAMYPVDLGRGPQEVGDPGSPERDGAAIRALAAGEGRAITAAASGYLQAIEGEQLVHLLSARDLVCALRYRPGDFVLVNEPLLEVWPAERVDDVTASRLGEVFLVGRVRTAEQDVEHVISQLVEIGVRALSPSLNDPRTTGHCIDWLGDALCRLLRSTRFSPLRYDDGGRLRVIARVSSFRGQINAAFNEIREYGAESVPVLMRLLETIGRVARQATREEDRAALAVHAALVVEQAERTIAARHDLDELERRYLEVKQWLHRSADDRPPADAEARVEVPAPGPGGTIPALAPAGA